MALLYCPCEQGLSCLFRGNILNNTDISDLDLDNLFRKILHLDRGLGRLSKQRT